MKPMVVLSNAKSQCATFFWKGTPDFYVGYRFIEHNPEILETPLSGIEGLPTCSFGDMPSYDKERLSTTEGDPWSRNWMASYEEKDPEDPIQLSFQAFSDGSAWSCGLDNQGAQKRAFFFEPVDDGILVWMGLTTREPVEGAISVQQCLRYSGSTNQAWRQPIACIPFLSEFDVQARGHPNDSLTYARKHTQWLRFPVQYTVYHTPPGLSLLGKRSSGEIDHGLIVRESLDRKHVSGMYWERTAYVSNRHPADCLHASVDFGPLEAGESRTVHGKFYFMEGTKDDLLEVWRRDFPK